ncbi:MAG: lamin tail domain-containing protein [Planctomycetota bacterium]
MRRFESLESRRLLAAMRVATYNVLQGSPANPTEDAYYSTILEAIGNESVAGVSQAIDLLVLQETNSNSINRIEAILDGLYSDDYAIHLSPGYAGLHYGFVYNTSSLQLLGTQNISGSYTRPPLRGHFQPIDASESETDFYVYSTHLKADSGGSDAATRATEANQIRANADALGDGENVLIVGDFNMKNSFEGAYSNLTASGPGQVLDPINSPGNWFNNNAFKSIHTQDPSGGSGMDDRFDLQFASGEFFATGGLEYIPGSYRAFGNNGTHSLNGTLTGTGAAPNVLNALRNASDHLPVVVDYEFQTTPPGATINETDGTMIVAENGYLDSYSIVLDTNPDFDVTVTLTPDSQIDIGAGPGVATTLIFSPQNATTPQTVPVIAFDDAVAEGLAVSTIVHSFSSADASYDTLANIGVDVIVVDDESPTVLINEVDSNTSGSPQNAEFVELYDGGVGNTPLAGLTLVLYDGATDQSYSAFDLDGFTTDDNGLFVIGNSSVNGVDFTFADGLLKDGADAIGLYQADASSFPNGTSVSLTNLVDAVVYGTDDPDDVGLLPLLISGEPQPNENENGNQNSESLSRLADGGLARRTSTYRAATPTPDALNIPRPIGFSILGSEAITASEGAGPETYTIALTSVPTTNVVITLDPDEDLDLGSGSGVPVDFTFTPSNAMSPQTVSVLAFDDALAEGLHGGLIQKSVASSDAGYNSLTLDDVLITINDNEALPPPSIVISEIMYNPASGGEGTAFSPEWVEIVNAGTATQDISGWKLSDEDGDWGAIPQGTLIQSGQVAVLFDGGPTAITTEANFRTTWGIPAGALVIGVDWQDLDNDPSLTNEVLQLQDPLGFMQDEVNFDDDSPSPTSWPDDSPEGPSIYLTDLIADNNIGSSWARSSIGVDGAVAANGFPFSNSDVGSPGVAPAIVFASLVVAESGGSTAVAEGGATDDFSIAWDSVPTDDVIVTLTPDAELDLGAGAGVAVSNTFTPANALTPANFVATAFDDLIDENAHSGSISFSTSSNDPLFNGIVVADLAVSITDNDTAGISIVESGGDSATTEGGAGDDFTIVLDTIPTGSVDITVTPDAQLDLGAGAGIPVVVTFTTTNALTSQTVSVGAVDDAIVEGNHAGLISFAITSTDTNYDAFSVPDLNVDISDNDSSVTLDLVGEIVAFTGPGTYTIEYFATSNGGDQILQAFQLPFAFDVTGVTFSGSPSDFVVNPVFTLPATVPLSPPFDADFGFAGTALGAGLQLIDGQPQSLFSIDLQVAAANGLVPGVNEVGRVVTTGVDLTFTEFRDENNLLITSYSLGTGLAMSVDSTPPTITDVKVAGSAWASSFLMNIDPAEEIGLSLPGPNQLVNLPYTNLDTIYVQFSEDIGTFTANDMSLTGVNTTTYTPQSVVYDPANFRATITLPSAVTADKLELTVFDGITDVAGNQLDGEWIDEVSLFSGDSNEGGQFDFRFDVLPGDFDDSDGVSVGDIFDINDLLFTSDLRADVDGSGSVSVGDVFAANDLLFTSLPSGSPNSVTSMRGSSNSLSSVKDQKKNSIPQGSLKAALVDLLISDLHAEI